jgi:hypothetical protein
MSIPSDPVIARNVEESRAKITPIWTFYALTSGKSIRHSRARRVTDWA